MSALRNILIRGLDEELYNEVEKFVSSYGISMTHANKIILKKGYNELLESRNIDFIKKI